MEKEDFEHLSIVTETTDTTAQRLFVNRKWQLPEGIRKKISQGELQLCPHSFYSIKKVDGEISSGNIFDTQYPETGYSNVLNSKMFAEDYFLLTEIRLRVFRQDYDSFRLIDNIDEYYPAALGEFNFSQESTIYFNRCPLSLFDKGRLVMSPPKMFYPQRAFDLELNFPRTMPMPQNTYIRAELNGIRTRKG
ncbi:MAG: hypothetical protein II956_08340 [Bacteroidales bacterium]|nr:hypothetical protein [Bacteroidales bacterium]